MNCRRGTQGAVSERGARRAHKEVAVNWAGVRDQSTQDDTSLMQSSKHKRLL